METTNPDVVKTGYLYTRETNVLSRIFKKTSWKKRLVVLKDQTAEGGAHLLIHRSERGSACHVPVASISSALEVDGETKSGIYLLQLERLHGDQLTLGFGSKETRHEWSLAIQLLRSKRRLSLDHSASSPTLSSSIRKSRVVGTLSSSLGDINRIHNIHIAAEFSQRGRSDERLYPVAVVRTDTSERVGMAGHYLITLTPTKVTLKPIEATKTKTRLEWPLEYIRRFTEVRGPVRTSLSKDSEPLLQLETSAHCGMYEGTYLFKAPDVRMMVGLVERFTWRKSAQQHTSPSAESGQHMDLPRNKAGNYLNMLTSQTVHNATTKDQEILDNICNQMLLSCESVSTPELNFWSKSESSRAAPVLDVIPPRPPPRPQHTLSEKSILRKDVNVH